MIEGLDGLELAAELQRQAEKQAKTVRVLARSMSPASPPSLDGAARFLEQLSDLNAFPRLELHGIDDGGAVFHGSRTGASGLSRLRELRDEGCFPAGGAASGVEHGHERGPGGRPIGEGATVVRVGTALFDPPESCRALGGDGP